MITPTDHPQRALVYMTGRNCEMFVEQALASLARQTHDALHVLFVDDASDDATCRLAHKQLVALFPERHTLVRNPERWGKARNAHVHLRGHLDLGEFVAVLDADDMLLMPDILARMADRFAAGFDAVWSNYTTDRGGSGGNGPLDPLMSPRTQGWRTSHFFSFRADLLRAVSETYFKDSAGAWLQAACDLAIAMPVLDQTRRYCYLPLLAYRYTCSNPNSHHNLDPQAEGLNSRHQRDSAAQVLAKPPLACSRPLFAGGEPEAQFWHSQRERSAADARALEGKLSSLQTACTDRTAVPSPPAANARADWARAAAVVLASRCPALVDLALIDGPEAISVGEAWALWRFVETGKLAPRVLEIGAGRLAAPLIAAATALGGQGVSLGLDRNRAEALHGRLLGAGLDAEVLVGRAVEGELHELTGRFPDPQAVAQHLPFDIIFVSADVAAPQAQDALLALPMLASSLAEHGFRFCIESADPAVRRQAAVAWQDLAPDLVYRDDAVGGRTLLVTPATPALLQ